MFDLTAGDVGKILNLTLQTVDPSQDPPVVAPLNLQNAASVILQFGWGDLFKPIGTLSQVPMSIVDAINGIVQYVFQAADLTAPAGFPFTGRIQYVVKVTFNNATIEYSSDIGNLTVKQKVGT